MRAAGMRFSHRGFEVDGVVWCAVGSLIQLRGNLGGATIRNYMRWGFLRSPFLDVTSHYLI